MKIPFFYTAAAYAFAFLAIGGALVGCPKAVNEPTPPKMDAVNRYNFNDQWAYYSLFQDGARLKMQKRDVDALGYFDDKGDLKVYFPLRATNEAAGKTVRWDALRRRVTVSGKIAPRPITLIGGRSYVEQSVFEKWTGWKCWSYLSKSDEPRRVGLATVETRLR